MYDIRFASPTQAAFTRRGRPGGASNIHQIQIHATRGPTTLETQVAATENWFANQKDRGGWGSSADFVVGPDSRVGHEIVIVQFGNWLRTFGSWSAGYGGGGAPTEYGAAEVGVAIEVAQPPKWDEIRQRWVGGDSDAPFAQETVDAVAWLCRHINRELEEAGGSAIPTTRLASWDQKRSAPIPRGYIGHEDLANGMRLGKTDPGQMWDWPVFLREVGDIEDNSMSPPITKLKGALHVWNNGATPLPRDVSWDRYEFRMRRK